MTKELELLIFHEWTSIDFYIVALFASIIIVIHAYGLRLATQHLKNTNRLKKIFLCLAGPLALLGFAWVLFSTAFIVGTSVFQEPIRSLADLDVAPTIGTPSPQTFAYQVGLQHGDLILRFDKVDVSSWSEVTQTLNEIRKGLGETDIDIQRGLDKANYRFRILLSEQEPWAGLAPGELFLDEVFPGSLAALSDFQPGDQLISINTIPLKNWAQLVQLTKKHEDNKTFKVELIRNGNIHTKTLNFDRSGHRYLGARSAILLTPPPSSTIREVNLIKVFLRGSAEVAYWAAWSFKKIPLLSQLPELRSVESRTQWFIRNPNAKRDGTAVIVQYLKLLAVLSSVSAPLILLTSPLAIYSRYSKKITSSVQFVLIISILGTLCWLFIASTDRYFIL